MLARGQQMQFNRLKRREFIRLAGGAAAWPFAARAQLAGNPYRIGILSPAERKRTTTRVFDGLRQGLRDLGYIDGRNIIIEYRLAAGDFSRLPAMAAELAQLPVDIVVPDGGDKINPNRPQCHANDPDCCADEL
jgi:putative tryptophan/tyrosine transport system substrate-binding protein